MQWKVWLVHDHIRYVVSDLLLPKGAACKCLPPTSFQMPLHTSGSSCTQKERREVHKQADESSVSIPTCAI